MVTVRYFSKTDLNCIRRRERGHGLEIISSVAVRLVRVGGLLPSGLSIDALLAPGFSFSAISRPLVLRSARSANKASRHSARQKCARFPNLAESLAPHSQVYRNGRQKTAD